MKLLKVKIAVDLDLLIADHIDHKWVAEKCVFWKDSWAINEVPGVTCPSVGTSVESFELVKKS